MVPGVLPDRKQGGKVIELIMHAVCCFAVALHSLFADL